MKNYIVHAPLALRKDLWEQKRFSITALCKCRGTICLLIVTEYNLKLMLFA